MDDIPHLPRRARDGFLAPAPPHASQGPDKALPARKTQGVTAVERALAILDSFLGKGSRSLADLAKATGLAKPTVMRALVSLERCGYVVRLADARYQLGAKAMQLGAAYRANFRLDQHVLPVLEWLARTTLESAAFHIRENDSRLCLFRVDSPQPVRDVSRPATLVPLDATSTGRVLAGADGPGPGEDARVSVFASSGVFDTQTASISTGVFGADRALAGALTISGPVERLARADMDTMSRALVAAAHGLSIVLGAALPPRVGEAHLIQL